MVKRFDDWPKRLSAYLRERQPMAFEWGTNDCMMFAARAVYALTGHDYFTEYAGYSDEASAAEALKKHRGVAGIITACLGQGSDKVLTARRGDVVLVKWPDFTAGIVDDSGARIALVSKEGLVRIPLSNAIRVWGY